MQFDLYSSQGKKLVKKVDIDETVFDAKVNKQLMRLAVLVYRNNQRQSTAHVKTRSEVRGGGRKPWKQKGTGRARHGSIRSPIWKGGGVVFGPSNRKNYTRRLPKGMKKAAIRSAFSYFTKQKRLVILEKVSFKNKHLTKDLISLTGKLPVKKKILYLHKGTEEKLYLGSKNLQYINVIPINEISVYMLLNHRYLVILEDALEEISKFWGSTIVRQKTEKTRKLKRKTKKVSEDKGRRGQKTVKIKIKGKRIETLGLSKRVVNVLTKQGIQTEIQLREIMKNGEKITGIGDKGVNAIKKYLEIS